MKQGRAWLRRMIGVAWCLVAATAWAQAGRPSLQCPQTTGGLYARIRSVGLDPQRVYHVRDASIDRPNLHLDLDDGTLAFTEALCAQCPFLSECRGRRARRLSTLSALPPRDRAVLSGLERHADNG